MFTIKKTERITSLKEIDALFERGHNSTVHCYPVRAVYQTYVPSEGKHTPPIMVLVSVAKKRLHHAVDRNRAKRQIREAYRLQHQTLTDTVQSLKATDNASHLALRIAFIWLSDTPQPFSLVSASINKILTTIEKKLSASTANTSTPNQ